VKDINMQTHRHCLAAACAIAAALFAAAAQAHVTLPPGGATAGSTYPATFRVGHACEGAAATTAVRVRLPEGFKLVDAQPRPGWTLESSAREVTWTASSAQAALPTAEKTTFNLRGRLPDKPGTLWFKVLQTCDKGSADWAEVPAGDGAKPAYPAARLDVLPAGAAPVDVRDAWARPTVTGQRSTGVYAKLTSGAGTRLLGGSSPLAEAVEVHEMAMEGDVMRMRALDRGLELQPGQPAELRPGGYHLMVTGLKQPLPAGSSLPVTLRFVDRDGREGSLELAVPVTANVLDASAHGAHRH
jgi:copper(I)-binding protein